MRSSGVVSQVRSERLRSRSSSRSCLSPSPSQLLQASDLVARVGQGGCDRCRGHGTDAAGLPCSSCEGLGLKQDLLELRLRNRSLRTWLTTPLERIEKRLPSDGRLRTLV